MRHFGMTDCLWIPDIDAQESQNRTVGRPTGQTVTLHCLFARRPHLSDFASALATLGPHVLGLSKGAVCGSTDIIARIGLSILVGLPSSWMDPPRCLGRLVHRPFPSEMAMGLGRP